MRFCYLIHTTEALLRWRLVLVPMEFGGSEKRTDIGNLLVGPPRQGRQARFGPCLDFGFLIRSFEKQPVKKFWGEILDLACLKFAVAALKLKAV